VTHALPPHHQPLRRFDLRRAVWRSAIALLAGTAAGLAASRVVPGAVAALVGWDLGGLVLLAQNWGHIARSDAAATHARAGAEDPGRTLVYVLVVLAAGVSLLSATLVSRRARAIAPGDEAALVALCLLAVALAWLVTQTAFTMRYAHLYYGERGEGPGGVDFKGGAQPSYLDFAYLAFTVGMCFQVSDCEVTSPRIRRSVLAHAVLSYAYTTVILAFTLNLVFAAAGS
jgi:uncharacterized membrane protein